MNVQIQAQGLEQVTKALESMAARGVRLRPLMAQIGTAMIASVHETFAQQGRPKWKVRSPLTEEIYAGQAEAQAMRTKRYQNAKTQATRFKIRDQAAEKRVGANSKILMDSGALRNSVMMGRVTDSEVQIGSSLIYARIQQLGGTITPKKAKVLLAGGYFPLKRVTIPARPYLGVQPQDIPLIERLTMAYIRGGK